jgi:DNA-binding response OmpR family regulator
MRIVLIDDDPLIRALWIAVGKHHGVSVLVFSGITEAAGELRLIDKSVPIYLDVLLGERETSLSFSKTLKESGFARVVLCTSYDPIHFIGIPWIDDVIGKEFPVM